MWAKMRGALGALAVVALVASAAWADDLQFYSKFASQEAEQAEGDIACCDTDCCQACCNSCWCLRDSMYGFFAFDGWANELDVEGANNFGFRVGLNAGIPVPGLRHRGIGMQIGASVGCYDLMGRQDMGVGNLTEIEDQTMLSAGVFKRSDCCAGDPFSWAVVYDHQFHNQLALGGDAYVSLGQFRGLFGYALSQQNEIGLWMTQRTDEEEHGAVEAVNQYNVFWRRYWECGGDTMVYFGAVEDPGEFVVGFDARVPLNSRWALFCAGHYIKPSADAGELEYQQEIWNVTAGVMFFLGCGQTCCGPNRWVPLLPVADNGTFALDLDIRVI